MNNDKDQTKSAGKESSNSAGESNSDQKIPTTNPLTGEESNVTQEDIDNEQKFKEALTERD